MFACVLGQSGPVCDRPTIELPRPALELSCLLGFPDFHNNQSALDNNSAELTHKFHTTAQDGQVSTPHNNTGLCPRMGGTRSINFTAFSLDTQQILIYGDFGHQSVIISNTTALILVSRTTDTSKNISKLLNWED